MPPQQTPPQAAPFSPAPLEASPVQRLREAAAVAVATDGPLFLGSDVTGVRPGSDDVLRLALAVREGRLA